MASWHTEIVEVSWTDTMVSLERMSSLTGREERMGFISIGQGNWRNGFGSMGGSPPASSLSFPFDLIKLGNSLLYAVLR